MKEIVCYFSATGHTRKLAALIAQELACPCVEIVPEEVYTTADLNWLNKKSRSSLEMADKLARPKMLPLLHDPSQYDCLYLGFPIWWYVAPTLINTFLEAYDFSGKKIKLFATSGGSGFGNTLSELQPSAPNAEFEETKVSRLII